MKFLTIYDGTIHSRKALQYSLKRTMNSGGELIVLQIFQSSLFVDYDAGPRAEEIARAEAARHQRDAEVLIREAANHGVRVKTLQREGNPIDEAVRAAQEEQTDLIIASERYKALSKKASCRVRLVPGTILVPVDDSEELSASLEMIMEEAVSSQSRIMLLGIIPEHLYSLGEKQELEKVRKKTDAAVRKYKKALADQRIEVLDMVRAGYPDEVILKTAQESLFSLVMLPSGGKTPSELTKAAAILLDEPDRLPAPIQILQPVHA